MAGHLLRLNEDLPARKYLPGKALTAFCTEARKPVGRSKLNIKRQKDIKENSNKDFNNSCCYDQNLFLDELIKISQNRNEWKNMIKHMMLV